MRTRTRAFCRLILFVLITVLSPHIMAGELGNCAEPLILRDGIENPFDCNDSPTFGATPDEFRAFLGEQNPVDFCIPEYVDAGTGISACTGSCNGGTGCPGTFSTPELMVNVTGEQLCGTYIMQVPQIDVELFGLDLCEASFDATADVIMTVDSTYTGPLTWVIDSGQAEIFNFQSKLGGTCGGVADTLLSFLEPTLIAMLESNLGDLLGSLSNFGVCPVDSLHPDLILP